MNPLQRSSFFITLLLMLTSLLLSCGDSGSGSKATSDSGSDIPNESTNETEQQVFCGNLPSSGRITNSVDSSAPLATGTLNNFLWNITGDGKNFAYANDGNLETRWDTDTAQVPGQSITIDLSRVERIYSITLDSTPSPGDYPRGYDLLSSEDGVIWSDPFASGSSSEAITHIPFEPISTRFLRIVQTDTSVFEFWSIHELNIEGDIQIEPIFEQPDNMLYVYDAVPGLDASPYYSFEVQKSDCLDSTELSEVRSWLNPYAWLTQAPAFDENIDDAYFSEFIGSWSHTYTNFEVSPDTPIVVKIRRLDKEGAPSGPITQATAHPADRVDSIEIIDGDVYVTMSQPGLVAIDIDGQLADRDAPRANLNGFGAESFPYRNELDGVHAVTIFATPFMLDKPDRNDPDVFVVNPGDSLPDPHSPSWKTLYFAPGIHKLSVDENGDDREWVLDDVYPLVNNKNYYIPGDAIVYGNMHDREDNIRSKNIRVFGLGTLSGKQMPHFTDFSPETYPPDGVMPEEEHRGLRMLYLSFAFGNVVYEGLTIADQPFHGIYIDGEAADTPPNYMRWVKSITWRLNNDGGGVSGNSYLHDSFFRHQDDGVYPEGIEIARNVFWSDVNGTPIRLDFLTNERGANFPESLPQTLTVEDIDIIFSRGVFVTEPDGVFAIITLDQGGANLQYLGEENTGQHLVMNNIRISDPRPQRYLMAFPMQDQNQGNVAGLTFSNIDYQFPNTWGWKSRLTDNGLPNTGPRMEAQLLNWNFSNVNIAGELLDASNFLEQFVVLESDYVQVDTFSFQ